MIEDMHDTTVAGRREHATATLLRHQLQNDRGVGKLSGNWASGFSLWTVTGHHPRQATGSSQPVHVPKSNQPELRKLHICEFSAQNGNPFMVLLTTCDIHLSCPQRTHTHRSTDGGPGHSTVTHDTHTRARPRRVCLHSLFS